jgi:hypothetical protein
MFGCFKVWETSKLIKVCRHAWNRKWRENTAPISPAEACTFIGLNFKHFDTYRRKNVQDDLHTMYRKAIIYQIYS